jgi:hypothetical protein
MSASLTSTTLNTRIEPQRKWWLLVLLLVCIPAVLVSSHYSDTMNQMLPETLPFPSTYNQKASGYAALYELCKKTGVSAARWESPYRQLDKERGTLVIALPWESLSKGDVDQIIKWVKAGNDLVYLDFLSYRSGAELLHQLKMGSKMHTESKDAVYTINSQLPEAANAPSLKVTTDVVVTGGNRVAGPDDYAFLTSATVGKGRVLVGSVPELCANKYIADESYRGNFQFMINWLDSSKKPILFDEMCHGYSSGSNVFFFVLKSPVGFVILQLMFITFVALLSLNQRFGQPVSVSNPRKISNLEFIDGLASTYQRARAKDTAWAMMFTPLKARLCKTLGVAPDAPLERLAAAWSESSGKPETETRGFLEQAQGALEKPSLSDQELRELVQQTDKLTGDARELQLTRRAMGA